MARTNPIGVRFDPEKLEFIKQREKLKSNQQVVDLLVNKYWWEWKVPIPTHKEAPPLNLKSDFAIEQPKNNSFEPLPWDNHKPVEQQVTFEGLLKGMANVQFSDEKEEYAEKINAATHLSEKQRKLLIGNLWSK